MEIVYERQKFWRSRYVLSLRRRADEAGWEVVAKIPAVWSEGQIAKMLHKHRRWLNARMAEEKKRSQKKAAKAALKDVLCELPEDWYRKAAKKILPARCAAWAKVMKLDYGQLRINGARSRWGSCSAQGNLSFSWRLLATRWDLVEYVVVHELAHRVHFNHGVRFWRLVEKYVPDYEVKRADLRELGGDLG